MTSTNLNSDATNPPRTPQAARMSLWLLQALTTLGVLSGLLGLIIPYVPVVGEFLLAAVAIVVQPLGYMMAAMALFIWGGMALGLERGTPGSRAARVGFYAALPMAPYYLLIQSGPFGFISMTGNFATVIAAIVGVSSLIAYAALLIAIAEAWRARGGRHARLWAAFFFVGPWIPHALTWLGLELPIALYIAAWFGFSLLFIYFVRTARLALRDEK